MSLINQSIFERMVDEDPMLSGEHIPPTLTLVRGLPGSGKSTFAETMSCWDTRHLEADMYFIQDGVYQFDSHKLEHAHNWCFNETVSQLIQGYNVVVSNTFTQMWELERYLAISEVVPGVIINVIEMKTQFRNIHGVSDKKLDVMRDRWDNIPQHLIDGGLSVTTIEPQNK